MRYFLTKLMATLTGHDRYMPDIMWSANSYVHNIFRVWEYCFGRRFGIRAEISTLCYMENGVEYISYTAHTFEASCALLETWIRSFKIKPFKIYIPKLITPTGMAIPTSPFLFAIAIDASGSGVVAASPRPFAHTCTGSNLKLFVTPNANTGTTATAVSFNSVASTIIGSNQTTGAYIMSMWYLDNPATGSALTVLVTSAGGTIGGGSISYSGCGTGIDSMNQGTDASTTTVTGTTTVVGANCWLIMTTSGDGSVPSASGGSTIRVQWQGGTGTGDSTGPVSQGSQSIVFAQTHTTGNAGYVVASFAPPRVYIIKKLRPRAFAPGFGR